jgi:hypothetical protein
MNAMPAWTAQLDPLLAAVRIHDDTHFAIGGRDYAVNDDIAADEIARRDDEPLLRTLHRALYAQFHIGNELHALDPAFDDDALLVALQATNNGSATWQHDWEVLDVFETGAVAATRHGRVVHCNPGEYAFRGAPARVARGERVDVLGLHESLRVQPGFYFAFGAPRADHFDAARLVRFYFNHDARGAVATLAVLTAALRDRDLPFAWKCPLVVADHARRDASVLYVPARLARLTWFVLREHLDDLRPHLRPTVPLLTRALAPGWSFAQDPEGDDSFGMHRTHAIAEGILTAHRNGLRGQYALPSVLESFDAHGIDLAAPHLDADGDNYDLHAVGEEP